MQVGMGFSASKLLLTGIDLGLFTLLASKGSMSAAEVRKHFDWKCSERHSWDFLDGLTGLGFLNREGKCANAKYSNAADSDLFLDENKHLSYCGGFLKFANSWLYANWNHLAEGLKTGNPQNNCGGGEDLFKKLYSDQDLLRTFVKAMTGFQMNNF